MKAHQFRKLTVWQRSVEFITLIYKITARFPNEEKYGLTDQIRRAAVSVNLNIAEGSGASSNIEFVRFLHIAQRSSYEVSAALEVSINLKMTDPLVLTAAIKELDQLSAMINGLIKTLKSETQTV